jgi:hypothetical protein
VPSILGEGEGLVITRGSAGMEIQKMRKSPKQLKRLNRIRLSRFQQEGIIRWLLLLIMKFSAGELEHMVNVGMETIPQSHYPNRQCFQRTDHIQMSQFDKSQQVGIIPAYLRQQVISLLLGMGHMDSSD